MKKLLAVWLAFALALGGCSKGGGVTVWEAIRHSPAAKLELPDGSCAYVDSEIDLVRSFADLELVAAQGEPEEGDGWLYRIVFNPVDRVKDADEIAVEFYEGYVLVGGERYAVTEGVLRWAESKFEYFMRDGV